MSLYAYCVHHGEPEDVASCVIAHSAEEAVLLSKEDPESAEADIVTDQGGAPLALLPWMGVGPLLRVGADVDRWLRDGGWTEDGNRCVECNLGEFESIPESQLDPEYREVCRECGWPEGVTQ